MFASTVPEQGSVDDSIGVEHRHGDDAVSLPLKAAPATGLTLWAVMAIIGIAMVGAAIRVAALLPIGAADQFPVDYDEGVYSAAASLFARGQMPYRDFFFVHPPGALYVLLPLGGFSPQTDFVAARFVMVGVGPVSIALVGLIACRRWGLLAGAVGAAVYACFPEAVQAEHGVFLEPLLNLFCLAALACWLRLDDRGKVVDWDGWALAAGALAAAAFTVKLWAVFAIAAMMLVPPIRRRAKGYRAFLVGLLVTGLVLWAPVLISARTAVIDQVLLFQFGRPGDGATSVAARVGSILGTPFHVPQARHLAATALALLGVVVVLVGWRRHGRLARIALLWWVLTVASFLVAATYWEQYNAALAPSMSLLAAAGFSWIAPAWRRPGIARSAAGASVVLALLVTTVSIRRSIVESTSRSADLDAIASDISRSVPESDCVIAFEPQWLLSADRLPTTSHGAIVSVDPYAAHLALVEQHTDLGSLSTANAFAYQPADDGILESLSACRYLLLGWRGHWQLSGEQQAWVAAHYRQLPQTGPVDLWTVR